MKSYESEGTRVGFSNMKNTKMRNVQVATNRKSLNSGY